MKRTAILALVLALLVPYVAADHVQNLPGGGGGHAIFDHRGGNEWWVELQITGAVDMTKWVPYARDDGQDWVRLDRPSWAPNQGYFVKSFHIEPGHRVQFKIVLGTDTLESCWFTHPAGSEQCEPHPDCVDDQGRIVACPFDATFTNVKGNEWWVEARVSANEPLAGVDARVNCAGAWNPLTLRSWGSWAASFRIPAGSKIDLRARSTSGAQDLSGGYIWPQATPTSACSSTPPPPFQAEFKNVKGNAWWVQTEVTANRPVVAVDIRVLGTFTWRPLAKQSWGGWATSFHIGTDIFELRARSQDGAFDTSYLGWWGSGSFTYPDPESRSLAEWESARGDETRITVNTFTFYRLTQHEYRVDGDAWKTMQKNADGDWVATGLSIPKAAMVEFRASWNTPWGPGSQLSGPMAWPPFPQEGSFIEYRTRGETSGTDDETGTFIRGWSDSYARIEFHERTGWTGFCDLVSKTYENPVEGPDRWTNSTQRYPLDRRPFGATPDTQPGERVDVTFLSGCATVISNEVVIAREQHRTALRTISGDPITLDTWHAGFSNADEDRDYWWDTRLGLLVSWRTEQRPTEHSSFQSTLLGWMLNTNAPL